MHFLHLSAMIGKEEKKEDREIMEEGCKIVYEGGTGELVEKKSRFIATVKPVTEEAKALEFIEAQKKKYWDARHNCYAYVIGNKNEIMRFSDDGEPSGTAGKPMLDVLTGEGVHNAVVVVTRYFGGTLLGTGGLVRAYSHTTLEGLHNSRIVAKQPGSEYEVVTDYNGVGKLQYLAAQMELVIQNTEYTENVRMTFLVPVAQCSTFVKKVTEATNGRAQITETAEVYFGDLDGEAIVFDRVEKEQG